MAATGEFVIRARERFRQAQADLAKAEKNGECADRIAALKAIVVNRAKQLESTIRAELVIPPR